MNPDRYNTIILFTVGGIEVTSDIIFEAKTPSHF
jgi:hypothetical protein